MHVLILVLLAADPAALPLPASPPLTATGAVADVGAAKTGPLLVHRFTITNPAAVALTVTGVSTPCGCVNLAVEPRTLAPGQSATVSVAVNTIAQAPGRHTWAGVVRSAAAGCAPSELPWSLAADLIREVTVTPPAIALSTGSDAAMTVRVVVVDVRPKPLAVRQVLTTNPALTAVAGPVETTTAGRSTTITLTLTAALPEGMASETLVIHTDDSACPELRVPVTITKRPTAAVLAVPPAAVVRLGPGEATASRLVRLRSPAGSPVTIASVVSDNPAVTAKWSPAPAPVAAVRAVVMPRAGDAKSGTATLTVTFADPPGAVVRVPVAWAVPD